MERVIKRFMQKYFEFKAVFGDTLNEEQSRRLFDKLAEVFMVRQAPLESLYKLCEDKAVKDIRSDEEFKLFMRIRQYAALYGLDVAFTKAQLDVMMVKGEALYKTAAANLINREPSISGTERFNKLLSSAKKGNVSALFMLAVANMEGVMTFKNTVEGKRCVSQLSKWMSADGHLLALHYGVGSKRDDLSRLYTVTFGTPDAVLYALAEETYGEKAAVESKEVALLMKAAEKGVIDRETFSGKYARIAFGDSLGFADKQRVIMSEDNELVSHVSGLPLKLGKERKALRLSAPVSTEFERVDEEKRLTDVLSSQGFCALGRICLLSRDFYLQRTYGEAIARAVSNDCHVSAIDLAHTALGELENTFANVFLRSVREGESNLFLIYLNGEKDGDKIDRLADFLADGGKRFKIAPYNITVDLSAVEVVVFADELPKRLEKDFTTLTLTPVSKDEKAKIIDYVVRKYEKKYGVEGVGKEDGVDVRLMEEELITVDLAVERAVQSAFINGYDDIKLDDVRRYISTLADFGRTIGFGG